MTFSLDILTATDLADATARQTLAAHREEAWAFLARTDWMILRRADTGEAVPKAVVEARQTARKALNDGA